MSLPQTGKISSGTVHIPTVYSHSAGVMVLLAVFDTFRVDQASVFWCELAYVADAVFFSSDTRHAGVHNIWNLLYGSSTFWKLNSLQHFANISV